VLKGLTPGHADRLAEGGRVNGGDEHAVGTAGLALDRLNRARVERDDHDSPKEPSTL
jgi:hypothetical protein